MAEREHLIGLRRGRSSYEEDYAAWLQVQIRLMKAGRWSELDTDKLIEEVEDIGRSEFKGFVGSIRVVLLHMLKWDYQPQARSRSWRTSIDVQRIHAQDELSDSPSHQARIPEAVEKAYRVARVRAAGETGVPLGRFPDACPYSWNEIMERDHPLDDNDLEGS